MITVLDYDAGNVKSVEKALDFLGEEVKITRDKRGNPVRRRCDPAGCGSVR